MSSVIPTPGVKVIHNPANNLITGGMGAIEKPDPGTLRGRLALAIEIRKGMNPNRLADATGMSRQAVYRVLDGKTRKLLWDTAVLYATELGVRPEWLQDGVLPMLPAPVLKDDDEIRLVEDFRHMSPAHQRDLAEIARRWAEEDGDGDTPHHHPFLRASKPPPRQ
jgi:transcriptional regulator with XRE-family HTH domain